jgi:hypothetical protein
VKKEQMWGVVSKCGITVFESVVTTLCILDENAIKKQDISIQA